MPHEFDLNTLKVLHLVIGDLTGGAARGAYWLHQGLLANGVNSRILTDSKINTYDDTLSTIGPTKKKQFLRAVRRHLDSAPAIFYPNRINNNFSSGLVGFNFTKTEPYAEASVIHLHGASGGFVTVRHLRKINKAIVWTLRDMWPMTGGCHYSMGCDHFTAGCGNCPQLGSSTKLDVTRFIHATKKRHIPASTKIVGISRWLSSLAKESAIFKNHDVRTISNGIDTESFFPIDKLTAKSIIGIQTEKKIILAGAQAPTDFYKGFDKYLQAIQYLNREKYHLCLFGHVDPTSLSELGFSYSSLGFLHDHTSLRLAYSAADVFVAPSIMEAFGKTLAESMACGTPVVCFDATGPRDIVDHKINGYRAKPFCPVDLARGIDWVCGEENTLGIGRAARRKSVEYFDNKVTAKQYIALYREAISHQNKP